MTMANTGAMTNRLPVHVGTSGTLSLRHHSTPRTISSVKGRTTPAACIMGAPTGLASEDGIVEAVKGAGTSTVDKGGVAHERDVVEAEVPDGGVSHAVGAEGHHGADYGSGEDVVLSCHVSFEYMGLVHLMEKLTQLWYSSMVRAPPMRQAPRMGA